MKDILHSLDFRPGQIECSGFLSPWFDGVLNFRNDAARFCLEFAVFA